MPSLSIIVPAYNEVGTIEEVLHRIQGASGLEQEILVVDDGSTDGTSAALQKWSSKPGMRILRHPTNRGKGAAIRTALPHVSGDIVLIQDADLEYDPKDYGILLRPILEDVGDVVIGSRFLGGPHRVLFYSHYVGNRLLTTLSNVFSNLNLTDVECGYKAFRTDVLRRISIKSDRFGVEPELAAKVARLGCRLYEVPVSYYGRTYAEGKKIGWKDGLAAVWTIFRFSFLDRAEDLTFGEYAAARATCSTCVRSPSSETGQPSPTKRLPCAEKVRQ